MLKDGKHTSLEPCTLVGEGRTKKEAEQAAARGLYEAMVAAGWVDPDAPPPPKKSGGPVRVAVGRAAGLARGCGARPRRRL